MRRPLLMLVMAASLVTPGCGPDRSSPQEPPLVVFAAASTALAMQEIAARFERETGIALRLNFAASSTLARQIEAGARGDIFISAHPQWMDRLEQRGLIEPASRVDLLSNRLVVVVPRESIAGGAPSRDLAEILSSGRVAVADPDHVPAGEYARAALRHLGLWDALRPVGTLDVRAALRLAEMGEVDAAVVYESDAAGSTRVVIAARIDPALHEQIVYPMARLRSARPGADALFRYLRGAEAAAIFARAGFLVPPESLVSPEPPDQNAP